MNRRRKLRRFGGIVAALAAMLAGFVPDDVQIVAWVCFTLLAFIVHVVALVVANRTVQAIQSAMRDRTLSVYQLAEMTAEQINAENHRSRETYRLLAVVAMLGIGVAAILNLSGIIAPLLFFIVAVLLLNSAIDQLERKELRDALRQEVELAQDE